MFKQNIKSFFENLFFNIYLKNFSNNIVIISFFIIWIFEWIFIFEDVLYLNTYTYMVFPYRIPVLLIFCFLYFTYIWGISVWRRTQFGRFTRGDRKLWYKGYSSFWIVELSTILGLFGAACWMNWGPRPLFPKTFYLNRKGFLIETTFFSYIMWILYLMRFGLKFNKWKTQMVLTLIIIFIVGCLIWRDLLFLIGRENLSLKNGSRWRYLSTASVIYSFVPDWWLSHFLSFKREMKVNSRFITLGSLLTELESQKISSNILKPLSLNDFEKYNFLPLIDAASWDIRSLPFRLTYVRPKYYYSNLSTFYIFKSNFSTLDNFIFYPRRIGFQTKKLAMWTLLLFLKIWHHFMLLIWWFLYLIRLINRRKTSYSLLSICHFNVYCCFLIGFLLFIYNYLIFYETIFKVTKSKPLMRTSFKDTVRFHLAVDYLIQLFYSMFSFDNSHGSDNFFFRFTKKRALRQLHEVNFFFWYYNTFYTTGSVYINISL